MYKRVVLKLSGEALGDNDNIFNHQTLEDISKEIVKSSLEGVGFAIIIGAGNIWRGSRQGGLDIERVRGDQMGMLATVINSLAMQDYLIKNGLDAVVMSPLPIENICKTYNPFEADCLINEGKAVIITCGVGSPFFSTDTGMMLRAAELKAELILAAKAIDGVYDKDPNLYSDAVKYDEISFDEVIEKNLKVIDATAAVFAKENKLKMMLFSLSGKNNIYNALTGKHTGTIIK